MVAVLNNQTVEAFVTRARYEKSKQIELIDDRVSGLRIRAGERAATWLLCIRLKNGKRTRIKLGSWPSMTVATARKAAQNYKYDISMGIDPNEEVREAARHAALSEVHRPTLGEVIEEYYSKKLIEHRRSTATKGALDGRVGLLRDLLNRDPTTLTRIDIANAVNICAKRAPISANRSLSYAKTFFNWCVNEEIIEANPADKIKKPSREYHRDRYHSLDELREIWSATLALRYPFGPLYRLLMVLPMRRDEVAAMPLIELALGTEGNQSCGIWTLPAARTKRANALRVPLSPLAQSLIFEALEDSARPPGSKYVFSMTGDTPISGFGRAKRRLDKIIQENRIKTAQNKSSDLTPMPHWTVHDLRTTFNTHACELLGVDMAVADRILNHMASATTSKVMRIYNKSELFDARKQALCEWAELIESQCVEAQTLVI